MHYFKAKKIYGEVASVKFLFYTLARSISNGFIHRLGRLHFSFTCHHSFESPMLVEETHTTPIVEPYYPYDDSSSIVFFPDTHMFMKVDPKVLFFSESNSPWSVFYFYINVTMVSLYFPSQFSVVRVSILITARARNWRGLISPTAALGIEPLTLIELKCSAVTTPSKHSTSGSRNSIKCMANVSSRFCSSYGFMGL